MLFVLLLLCCVCAGLWHRRWRLLRLTASTPTLAGALPIVGHAHILIGDSEYLWTKIQEIQEDTNKQGGIIKGWLGPMLYFVVTDPNIAQTILSSSLRKNYLYNFMSPWLGQGLLTADVPTWKRHRKLLNPTFNQQILDGFVHVFNRQSSQLVGAFEKDIGKEIDILPTLLNSATKSICQTAMGISSSDKRFYEEYTIAALKMFNILVTRVQHIWMHLDFVYSWTKNKKEEDSVVKDLKRTARNVLIMKKATMDPTGEEKIYLGHRFKAFLDVLMELKAERLLTDEEVIEEVETMIVGGSDTTARTLMSILVFLGSYPDIQERVYKEIQDVLDKVDRDVEKTDFSKFVYMEAVIKETLRIYPVAPAIARDLDQDFQIGNHFLPSGSGVIILLAGIHRNKCWGSDAEVFRPDRWLDGSIPEDAGAFAAFGLGRRSCIGRLYAMMSMKTTLAHVLRRYKVTADQTSMKMSFELLLKPISGHHVCLEIR